MNETTINNFLRQNPVLMEKNRGRTDVRAILENYGPEEIGNLVWDSDYDTLQKVKNILAAHIDFLLKKLRRAEREAKK
jgi:hypothetical protein